ESAKMSALKCSRKRSRYGRLFNSPGFRRRSAPKAMGENPTAFAKSARPCARHHVGTPRAIHDLASRTIQTRHSWRSVCLHLRVGFRRAEQSSVLLAVELVTLNCNITLPDSVNGARGVRSF